MIIILEYHLFRAMQRLIRALATTAPMFPKAARPSLELRTPVVSRNYVTPSVMEELQEQNFTRQRLKPLSQEHYDRYDFLPQDPNQVERLHAMDLFHGTVENGKVMLDRLVKQVFSLPATDRIVDGESEKSTVDRSFGQFDEEFLTDENVQLAIQECLKTLTLTNLKNKESFVVGIHAFKLHIDPTNPELLRANATIEGVHQDGSQIVMIIYAGAKNVSMDSAKTYLWTLDQPKGQPDMNDPEQLKNLIAIDRLNESGEYFILSDRNIQHHVGEILQCDERKPAERKVMVVYIRDSKEADRKELDLENPINFTFPCE